MRLIVDMRALARTALVLALAFALFDLIEQKVFKTRCQLTRELMRNNFPKTFLSNWVCLIEQESNKDTAAYTEKSSRRKYYGLFQIPGEWCKEGRKGGRCDISCESLLDDDIRDDSVCAQKIFDTEGFKYWSKWEARCKGHTLPDIEKCPDFMSPTPGARASPPRARRRIRRDDELMELAEALEILEERVQLT